MEIAVMPQPDRATGAGTRELTGRLLELGGAAYRMSVHALGSADAAEDVVQQA
jgi:DNA-directed RNA polymerase specialized sigma24 family protein